MQCLMTSASSLSSANDTIMRRKQHQIMRPKFCTKCMLVIYLFSLLKTSQKCGTKKKQHDFKHQSQLNIKTESNINSVERSRSAAVTEVKKALLAREYCSVLPLIVFKSPSSKNLEEFKTEIVFETEYYGSTKFVTRYLGVVRSNLCRCFKIYRSFTTLQVMWFVGTLHSTVT